MFAELIARVELLPADVANHFLVVRGSVPAMVFRPLVFVPVGPGLEADIADVAIVLRWARNLGVRPLLATCHFRVWFLLQIFLFEKSS